MSASASGCGLNDIVRVNASARGSLLNGRAEEFGSIFSPLSLAEALMLSEPKYGRPSSTFYRLIVIL